MKKEFWLERWEREEIGFHEHEVNAYLAQFWSELHLARGNSVFVPLCGKSVDMKWLQQQGYTVLGIELSVVAVQAFFSENGYAPKISGSEKLKSYETSGLRILCGDFFDLSSDDLAKITAVYDRAAMVALPPEMRKNYVSHLVSILPAATQIMLITFDYPQSEMSGPPFALAADEVEALYGMYADIRLLAQVDVLAQNPRFQKRGLTRLQESIYLLTLR